MSCREATKYQRRGNMMYYLFINCFCRALYLEHRSSLLWCNGVVILFIRYLTTLCIIFKELIRTLHGRKWLVGLPSAWSFCLKNMFFEDEVARCWSV